MIKKFENKIDKFCKSEYATKKKSDSHVREPMSVKDSLNKFKDSMKFDKTIEKDKSTRINNVLQPINSETNFNPLSNDNFKEC